MNDATPLTPPSRLEQYIYADDHHTYSHHCQMSHYNYTSRYDEDWSPSSYYTERPSDETPYPNVQDRRLRENGAYQMSKVSPKMSIFTSEHKTSSTSMQDYIQEKCITEEQLQQYNYDTLETDLQQLEEKVLAILIKSLETRGQEDTTDSYEELQHPDKRHTSPNRVQ